MSMLNKLIIEQFRKSKEFSFLNWLEENEESICKIEKNVSIAEEQNQLKNTIQVTDQRTVYSVIVESAQQPPHPKNPTSDLKQKDLGTGLN